MISTDEPCKKPKRKLTRKLTRKPIKTSISTRHLHNCDLFDDEVTVERDGSKFTFKWNGTYGSRIDYDDLHYEYGEFYEVETFAPTAPRPASRTSTRYSPTEQFRGIDYIYESDGKG